MTVFYRFLTNLFAPLIALYLRFRKTKGREDELRFRERLGFASASRPSGKLAWCHAASVGEVLSVLSLLTRLRANHPDWAILLTTGTVTSAALIQSRLPDGVVHQYVPVDRWPYVTRFLNHWKPDLVLWVESELWPNMLSALYERHIPAILLNGRMSEKSYKRWRLIRTGLKRILGTFVLGMTQTGAERARYAALGLRDVRAIGNLKFAADPLPCDEAELAALNRTIGDRPRWLMASTHPGEDEIALALHHTLHQTHPDLLTIIAPRHPARADEIAALIAKAGLHVARRSRGEPVTSQTQIYLADTMGELGLLYRLCPICCLAGSFTWGGHNPVEPALLKCAVVVGPKMDNFAIMADDMLGQAAAIQVADEAELAEVIARLIESPHEVQTLAQAAHRWAESKRSVLDETLKLLEPFFTTKDVP